MSEQRRVLGLGENLLVGVVGGATETVLQMPLITMRFMVQSARPLPPILPLGPWYRGVGAQAGSVGPITGVQVMTCGFLQSLMLKGQVRQLADSEVIVSGLGAGALSSLIYTPADLITIQQQKHNLGFSQAISHIIQNNHGLRGLFRGTVSCAVREAIYTCGYLAVAPILKQKLITSESAFKGQEFMSSFVAACIAGTGASMLTHPIDTSKTLMQADLKGVQYPTALSAAKQVYSEQGIKALFRGAVPRVARSCGAAFIIGHVREYVTLSNPFDLPALV